MYILGDIENSNKKIFLYASRLINEKGILNFIEAARKFNKRLNFNNDIEFLIAGKFINNELKWKTKKGLTYYIIQ